MQLIKLTPLFQETKMALHTFFCFPSSAPDLPDDLFNTMHYTYKSTTTAWKWYEIKK